MMDEEDKRVVELADLFAGLAKTAGFQELKALAQAKADEFVLRLTVPGHERQKDVQQPTDEYLRGAIYGLQFCFAQTRAIIESAQQRSHKDNDDE
jgi:hypothetical protein